MKARVSCGAAAKSYMSKEGGAWIQVLRVCVGTCFLMLGQGACSAARRTHSPSGLPGGRYNLRDEYCGLDMDINP